MSAAYTLLDSNSRSERRGEGSATKTVFCGCPRTRGCTGHDYSIPCLHQRIRMTGDSRRPIECRDCGKDWTVVG